MRSKILLVVCALMLVTGCKTRPLDAAGQLSGGMSGVPGTANVVPGTQSDLEANVGDRVFFAYDSSALNAESQATLMRQATWLKTYPSVALVVEGHCDERGTREYNLGLGNRRANSARNFLVNAGVDPARLSVISYGKERPAVLGSGEEVYAQNRRSVSVVGN